MTQRETAPGGLPFFAFAAVRRDKKEPPGAARRAAQAGGILESFRDHHTAPPAAVFAESGRVGNIL